jgi:hypothetical protein
MKELHGGHVTNGKDSNSDFCLDSLETLRNVIMAPHLSEAVEMKCTFVRSMLNWSF